MSSAKAGDNGRFDALAQACSGHGLAQTTLLLAVDPTLYRTILFVFQPPMCMISLNHCFRKTLAEGSLND